MHFTLFRSKTHDHGYFRSRIEILLELFNNFSKNFEHALIMSKGLQMQMGILYRVKAYFIIQIFDEEKAKIMFHSL